MSSLSMATSCGLRTKGEPVSEHPCMNGGACQCGGNCGCAARNLEAVWFPKTAGSTKLAADMKKLLAEIFRGVQPHVKNWRKFLVEMEDALRYWTGRAEIPLTSQLKSIYVHTTYEMFEGKQLGGGWDEPPYYEEHAFEVPESIDFYLVHTLDLRRLPMFLGKAQRSNIQNAAGFSQAISDVINNSAAMNMIGKIMLAVVKNYVKDDQGWEFLSEVDVKIWKAIEDELHDNTDTSIKDEDFDPMDLKFKKVWYKLTSKGIEIHFKGESGLQPVQWELLPDAFEPDYDEWDYRERYSRYGAGSKTTRLGYDA